ncbi:MAG: hypothetical protein ACFE85_16915 [Candidatus Hodarchaeota archaeon]
MALEALDITNGVVLILFCALSIYLGIRISAKYFKYRQRQLLLVGLTWIFLVCPWYPASISFIMVLIIGESLTAIPYFIIGNIFIPIAVILWIIALTDFIYKTKQKLLVSLFTLYGIVFYVLFFIFISTDPSLIGYLKGYTDVQYNTFTILYVFTILIIALSTGILFARESLKSEDPEIRLKGKFLLLAFLFFVVGSFLDAIIPLNFLTLPIIRTIEILSAITFYCGFILPKPVKNFFLKKTS